MTLALATLILTASAQAREPYRTHQDAVVSNLNAQLRGTPMQGTGVDLEYAGRKWNVHPAFIAAVAGVESSYGRLACRNDRHNAYGLASCRGYYWSGCRAFGVPLRTFASWRDSYLYFARFIAHCWPGVNSPTTIGYSYCPPCGPRWGASVSWHMQRFGYAPRVRYGR